MVKYMDIEHEKKQVQTARKILSKLIWDPRYNLRDFEVVYIDRGAPNNISVVHCSLIQVYSNAFSIDETEIPYHRILEIRRIITGVKIFSRSPPKTSGV